MQNIKKAYLIGLALVIFFVIATSFATAQDGGPDDGDSTATDCVRNPSWEIPWDGQSYFKPWGKKPKTSTAPYVETAKPYAGARNLAINAQGASITVRQKLLVYPGQLYEYAGHVATTQGDSANPGHLTWSSDVTGETNCGKSNSHYDSIGYSRVLCSLIVPGSTNLFRIRIKTDVDTGDFVVADAFDFYPVYLSRIYKQGQAVGLLQHDNVTHPAIEKMTGGEGELADV